MRVFVTGANGFVGSAIVSELLEAGYQVLGLTRSDAGARALGAAGAEVHRGDLDDLVSLQSGVGVSDAVIHTAFNHDFSKFAANCEADRRVIEAIGAMLVGSDRPFIVTTAIAAVASRGQLAVEIDDAVDSATLPRAASDEAAVAVASGGVNVSLVRLPQVHDRVKQGLATDVIALARKTGISAYVGDGNNRWPAVHLSDAARLYRLALEKREANSRYHAVAEEGICFRDIAVTVGRGLGVPVVAMSPKDAATHFGWLYKFVCRDFPASSADTQNRLDWHPIGPGLTADLERVYYIEV